MDSTDPEVKDAKLQSLRLIVKAEILKEQLDVTVKLLQELLEELHGHSR